LLLNNQEENRQINKAKDLPCKVRKDFLKGKQDTGIVHNDLDFKNKDYFIKVLEILSQQL